MKTFSAWSLLKSGVLSLLPQFRAGFPFSRSQNSFMKIMFPDSIIKHQTVVPVWVPHRHDGHFAFLLHLFNLFFPGIIALLSFSSIFQISNLLSKIMFPKLFVKNKSTDINQNATVLCSFRAPKKRCISQRQDLVVSRLAWYFSCETLARKIYKAW